MPGSPHSWLGAIICRREKCDLYAIAQIADDLSPSSLSDFPRAPEW